jgi:two-component system LytT family response regulator
VTIRTVIVDDEAASRQSVRRLLWSDAEVTVVGESDHGAGAVATIRRLKPDLLFLGIRRPEADGFRVIRDLGPAFQAVVVFTSTSKDHALKAFELHAADYLLKPLRAARFQQALAGAKRRVWESRVEGWGRQVAGFLPEAPPAAGGPDGGHEPATAVHLLIPVSEGRLLLRQADVCWVGADGDHVQVHVGPVVHVVRDSLRRFATRLDPSRFIQIHRSNMVNLERVKQLQRFHRSKFAVILNDGTRLPVSRRCVAALESRLALI